MGSGPLFRNSTGLAVGLRFPVERQVPVPYTTGLFKLLFIISMTNYNTMILFQANAIGSCYASNSKIKIKNTPIIVWKIHFVDNIVMDSSRCL